MAVRTIDARKSGALGYPHLHGVNCVARDRTFTAVSANIGPIVIMFGETDR